MSDPDIFLHALDILVQRVHEQGYGVDEVIEILEEHGKGGEDQIRTLVEDRFKHLQRKAG